MLKSRNGLLDLLHLENILKYVDIPMKDIVYRNHDKYAIKHLLAEIGAHKIRLECEAKHLNFPKRLGLFFLEAQDDCTMLKYDYPQKGVWAIMKIDRMELPEAGWTRVRLR